MVVHLSGVLLPLDDDAFVWHGMTLHRFTERIQSQIPNSIVLLVRMSLVPNTVLNKRHMRMLPNWW